MPNTSAKKKNKLELYLEICNNFKPVFRYFFMENFKTPATWYEKRLNYTRSVATASIVGYCVGLGDRHVQNILIDSKTADIIHIDLGIAFDQGKMLPIPETVPFRLTRDIVDGFGICGVEGIFRNSCETILELLKNSREQIMTIFEVLLYDPLHNWCLSPRKAYILQNADNLVNSNSILSSSGIESSSNSDSINDLFASLNKTNSGKDTIFGRSFIITYTSISNILDHKKNKIAERILFQLKQKLLGYENGAQLSTSGHINYLINEAVNPENLCRIYVGWQPYL